MNQQHPTIIAKELQIHISQVAATVGLLAGGATVPFISRYRKEATGSLDEVQVTAIRDRLAGLAELDKRRQSIIESLAKRELLSGELKASLYRADNLTSLEDIYLPYKLKRRTRAMIAGEKGLEPLAQALFKQHIHDVDAAAYVDHEKGVGSIDDAYAGARDIIAEWVSENREIRIILRKLYADRAVIVSKVVKKNQEMGRKFSDYFDWREEAKKAPGHRLLALFRGENEKVLSLSVKPPDELTLPLLKTHFVKNGDRKQVELALIDSYKRLLGPSLENELRNSLKERADREAIGVFADNLRELLLAAPLGQIRIMALDPGFRTGAKLVCLDEQGTLLYSTTIYPVTGSKKDDAAGIVKDLCRKYDIEAIAIGNGTAGRETESFIRDLNLDAELIVTLVNEDGASIYSASEVARREFPEHDVTVRGAISIGRRLQDPLAELVKLEPKSIGVGQYQHDVNQSELKKSLEDVVVSCVNSVGVEVNSASLELLTYVSGLGPSLAASIIEYRNDNGPYTSRREFMKVPRLGAKAFEQSAGFLRIHDAKNSLDGSGVHPERYSTVEKMAADVRCTVADLMAREDARRKVDIRKYVSETLGLPTLQDIMDELAKPGRDPREKFTAFVFEDGVHAISDLLPEMRLPGIITNVTKFGAFVDIGVHQDGLIHISQLADRFVKDPAEIVKVRERVTVRVIEVDEERGRISLSLRDI
ncbi:MAG: RNA-binding transcriptional accessory protein [Desulfofustis sp.]|nr:RNA-binding transcriptional accessory protein [Desulfofustis sp.]